MINESISLKKVKIYSELANRCTGMEGQHASIGGQDKKERYAKINVD